MKVDFSIVLNDIEGKAILAGGEKPLTLGLACAQALIAVDPQANEAGDAKYASWRLASKVGELGVQEITPEEASLIKSKVGAAFGPVVVGPVYSIINAA